MKLENIREAIENKSCRSAWARGVREYALELLDNIDDEDVLESPSLLRRALLNGASSWQQYSDGGCALIYDGDIAERLCTPSELKRTRGGERRPNPGETWLDVQTRALHQAQHMIEYAVREAARQEKRGA